MNNIQCIQYNRLQARFLDSTFLVGFFSKASGEPGSFIKQEMRFESKYGDVFLAMRTPPGEDEQLKYRFSIKLKPIISDNYPKVIRQAQKLGPCDIEYKDADDDDSDDTHSVIVVCETFHSDAVTLEQAKRIFMYSGIKLLTLQEIENEAERIENHNAEVLSKRAALT